MSTTQGSFEMVKVGERVEFAEVIPRNGHKSVLHVADHPHSRVTFDLNGARFKTQGFRLALMGASGAGKSNALAVVAEEVHRVGYPFLIFDQEGEFTSLADLTGVQGVAPDLSPGAGAVRQPPALRRTGSGPPAAKVVARRQTQSTGQPGPHQRPLAKDGIGVKRRRRQRPTRPQTGARTRKERMR